MKQTGIIYLGSWIRYLTVVLSLLNDDILFISILYYPHFGPYADYQFKRLRSAACSDAPTLIQDTHQLHAHSGHNNIVVPTKNY